MRTARILIAEDDGDDQLLLKTAFLENGGAPDLTFVADGVELLACLENVNRQGNGSLYPDLIMLDLNMPRKSGKEALHDIKKHPDFKRIPVIIYTTTRDALEIKRCYALGANNYIVKPSTFDSMLTIVRTMLQYWLATASLPRPAGSLPR